RLAPEYEAAATRYGVSGYPTLKDGEEAGAYDGPRTADGIVSHLKFISDKDASVVGFFRDLFSDGHSEFLKFAHTNVESLVKEYDDNGEGITLFRPSHLANKFEDKDLLTAYYDVDYEKKTFSHELSDFGLESTTGEVPVVAIRFVMQEEFSRFLQDYFDGNLKRYLKSEPIPETNDGPVKMDATANDVPSPYEVKGFPTIYFSPANKK
uniref:Protein disulfide-isomerase A3 (Fragments) n=1 Tax=Mesocricetus auratus TaxID=10036 RepID=PDIA3_MESAU|nr:RecName: Full=Protein disulfide-isomerase A3 [Mesocricetus auratus]